MLHPTELRVVAYLSKSLERFRGSRRARVACTLIPVLGTLARSQRLIARANQYMGRQRTFNVSVRYSWWPIGYICPQDTFVPMVKLYRYYRKET